MDELKVELDLDIGKWPLIDQMDFEKAVKMTVQRAAMLMAKAGVDDGASEEEKAAARAERGGHRRPQHQGAS